RTQELLAARRVDGTEQYFTRALDFGFSKTPEETFAIWDNQAVLADMVWVIRRFRPDVLVTRFAPTGGGHGHHSASALLSKEAFEAAADPTRFPEQLAHHPVWQAKRLLWNAYRWDGPQQSSKVQVDVGQYDPLLGKSYAELSAESRSMHRSQGFGAVPTRGSRKENFELVAGDPALADPMEGVDLSWKRVPGSEAVEKLLKEAHDAYRSENPEAILPILLKAKVALDRLPTDPWLEIKRGELLEAIRCTAGIWVEALADRPSIAPGEELGVAATILARGGTAVHLAGITLGSLPIRNKALPLPNNQSLKEDFRYTFPLGTPYTQPYWLREPAKDGMEGANPPELTGLAQAPPVLQARFQVAINGVAFELTVPVHYRMRDPVLGERTQPLVVLPPVMVNVAEPVQVFGDATPRQVEFTVIAGAAQSSGSLQVRVPKGWRAEPSELPFALTKPFAEQKLHTRITPPALPQLGELSLAIRQGEQLYEARGLERVDYSHLPIQTLFPPAKAKLTRVDLKHNGKRIGYVMGAGDEIAQCLRPLGYEVEVLSDEALATTELSRFDAIVVGIRAFNTKPRLAQLKARLHDYVAKGGTEIVLYAVNNGLVTDSIGPLPFKVGRDRVTNERAEMKILAPDHQVLNWPNKITAEDFKGWVQERGLYFAEGWDARYTPIFSIQDPGEKPSEGSLIVAKHGQGHFVYTGLSFFRQLPDGVPGAYRLFANLLALGSHPKK
ncbi:MAG: hypothetical protein Q8O00_04740, partial [Holophaga sp.]|nr:hypothetical protein [Holophaga sp.]